jgi:hypothetical protein
MSRSLPAEAARTRTRAARRALPPAPRAGHGSPRPRISVPPRPGKVRARPEWRSRSARPPRQGRRPIPAPMALRPAPAPWSRRRSESRSFGGAGKGGRIRARNRSHERDGPNQAPRPDDRTGHLHDIHASTSVLRRKEQGVRVHDQRRAGRAAPGRSLRRADRTPCRFTSSDALCGTGGAAPGSAAAVGGLGEALAGDSGPARISPSEAGGRRGGREGGQGRTRVERGERRADARSAVRRMGRGKRGTKKPGLFVPPAGPKIDTGRL